MKEKWKTALPVILVLVFALSRWPGLMPQNFSAVYGLLFCAGVFFPFRMAWWLPLGTLVVTDLLLNWHYASVQASPISIQAMVFGLLPNYLAYLALIWLGKQFTPKTSWLRLLGGGIFGAILFYLVSNTGAWLQNDLYAKTLAGWIQALTIGTPGWPPTWEFFRNTLISGGLFTGLFAGAMKLSGAEEEETEEEAEVEEGEAEESPA